MQRLQKSHIFFLFLHRQSKIERFFRLMTLHIFNPEHDIALAANLSNFTAPRAGRQLRHDLGFLPVLWAKEGDEVLVDDVEYVERQLETVYSQLEKYGLSSVFPLGIHRIPLRNTSYSPVEYGIVEPWGWDRALCAMLKRRGFNEQLLPTDEQLQRIRALSHRRTAARLLPLLQMPGTVGEAFECATIEEVQVLLDRYGYLMLKAPWSSSGRGVRPMKSGENASQTEKWAVNVLKSQGNVMVEPYYQKVMDFGMEFTALENSALRYDGLSLFQTQNGAYTGNLLATERKKREIVSRYIPLSLLDSIQQKITECLNLQDYRGPLGIDMMIVEKDGRGKMEDGRKYLLHPCVEINLRRTMGHVALSLTPGEDDRLLTMSITYDGSHYLFNIKESQIDF